ncbi:MAG TPA: BamA/TamA family outer membrane protein [bacterium]|nr:BamA/TamA family outer membrane protein [bacterium]HQG45011.1 BamA/TamA family outer membrane protein [bacterium]HQI47656.1 BamA/TamA family outer membrane protein [bacterium]HQJ63262.1 BamA/TamA family outer membrane protein [bacterium]
MAEKIRAIALLLAVIFSGLAAQPRRVPLGSITLEGRYRWPREKVLQEFGLAPGAPFSAAELPEHGKKLLQSLAAAGYWYARLDSMVYTINADSSQAQLCIYLDQGREIRTEGITLSGMDSVRARALLGRFNTHPGRMLDAGQIEADLDDALLQLDKEGLPFARFELESLQLDSLTTERDGLALEYRATPGPRLILRDIQISGNHLTRPGVILKEIRIRPGEPYSQQKVARIVSRLMKLGYFKKVEEPVLFYTAGEEGGLLLRVEEGQSSRFDGVLGYTPGSVAGKGYFTGLVDISLGNLLGTGRTLYAHWQKKDRQTQDISLRYREPWVAGWPVHLGTGFTQLIQDTTYVQRDLVLEIVVPLLENFAVQAQASRSEIVPDSLGSYLFGLLRSSTLNGSLGIEYDSRDDRLNPRQGVYYATSYQSGRKRNLGPEELLTAAVRRQTITKRIALDLEVYTPLFKRQILAVALHGRQIKSGEPYIPIPDQYRLGGAKTLRGYREDQFRGSSVAWSSLEYRYWMGRRSRTFLFADYGYYSAPSRGEHHQAFKLGYGLGFRLETGLGIMSLDYGLGRGDDPMAGKIHVGLINEF